jgi:hypothetical protein
MSTVQLAWRLDELIRSALWIKLGIPFRLASAKKTSRESRSMSGAALIALMGFICMATLFIGLGFVFPVSSAVGDLFDFLAVASGMFVIGLLDDG